MPGSILNTDINFPHFTGKESTEQKIDTIQNYLFMLYEQLRYSMGNLGTENFSEGGIKDLEQIVAKRIDLSGYVTFSSLSEPGQTVINGANLMTGTVTADEVVANISIQSPSILGGAYHDSDMDSTLDISSFPGFICMRYGDDESTSVADSAFGIVQYANNHVGQLYLGGERVMLAGGTTHPNSVEIEPICVFGDTARVMSELSFEPGSHITADDTLRITLPSGNYWEIGDGEIVLYDNSGTELNRVVLEA